MFDVTPEYVESLVKLNELRAYIHAKLECWRRRALAALGYDAFTWFESWAMTHGDCCLLLCAYCNKPIAQCLFCGGEWS